MHAAQQSRWGGLHSHMQRGQSTEQGVSLYRLDCKPRPLRPHTLHLHCYGGSYSGHSQTHCLSKDGSIGHRTAYTANTDRMGRLKLPSTLLKVGEREWLTNPPTATTLPTCDLSLLYAGPSHRFKALQQGTVGEGRTAYKQER